LRSACAGPQPRRTTRGLMFGKRPSWKPRRNGT
jgi:hypothetical protein